MQKGILCMLVAVLATCAAGQQDRFEIRRPDGKENFITDQAGLISESDANEINTIARKLLTEKATPILVVTIDSMGEAGGGQMRIETFAHMLFDSWGIGHAKLKINGEEKVWNTGILLLVSKGDRKARIQLGAHWGHRHDEFCQTIMDEAIVPRFKKGEFSGGILAGVKSLASMARDKLEIPAAAKVPRPWWHYALVVGAIGLAIFTVVSLVRRGSGGWAWLLWGAIFAIVGFLLYRMLTQSSRGGGGFGGGSFGGGFSGGGGATGSW
jgi:uncharacterized protein